MEENQIQSRRDMEELLERILEPLDSYFSEGKARIPLGATSAHFGYDIAEMEAFSRVLWGLVPAAAGGAWDGRWECHLEGIKNGTNPEHPEFWGWVHGIDQRLVEMAAIGFGLAMIPGKLWTPLTETERHHLYQWLDQINQYDVVDNNWHFFRVLVNTGFDAVGMPVDEEKQQESFDFIESCYQGDGWYADGPVEQWDYYISFGFHFYGLLYAALQKDKDPERAELYKKRAARFADDFIYWFSDDGSALPFGRSLTYRFAQVSFWSACVYAELPEVDVGVAKGLIMRHIRWWMEQPVFSGDGLLTIGYAYPNLIMAENYNSPGSPYWALKTFLVLALPEEHAFWQVEEKPMPQLERVKKLAAPRMTMMREGSHVFSLVSGQYLSTEHSHNDSKYAKFAYSTRFGFHVPKGVFGPEQGAFDSMLAFSEEDGYYRGRRRTEVTDWEDGVLYSHWKPWRDVDVETWLLPAWPWQVRVHRIHARRPLDARDGGFSVPIDVDGQKPLPDIQPDIEENDHVLSVELPAGISVVADLSGERLLEAGRTEPNTNLLYAAPAVLPAAVSRLSGEDGPVWYGTAVYAGSRMPGSVPEMIRPSGESAEVVFNGKTEATLRSRLEE
ncbi:DUF2264 domain-containing protein [Salibacterium qingdaonense]|uniref:DUF2264 domain-containing protein n=1 Tax=Salibacterium qingdaonense TaxID=266892 RepID=A0A1I4N569_9BACI|nr:DUF2264 domain-containing protein [Salibacterium qingdaonense]SFM10413.1 hypothetical protein SAMN04488054_11530 [Salibacterium qingdaonense]